MNDLYMNKTKIVTIYEQKQNLTTLANQVGDSLRLRKPGPPIEEDSIISDGGR